MKLPHVLRYTDKVEGASQKLFVIRINPKYKGDEGLYAHEYEHLKQWYMVTLVSLAFLLCLVYFVSSSFYSLIIIPFFVHNLLYRLRVYRKWAEVRAFKEHLKHYNGEHLDWAANALSKDYNLNITFEQAKTLLQS